MKIQSSIFAKTLTASTLMETIVASIIFMIVFLMGMHTLTRLMDHGVSDTDYLLMESELQKLRKSITFDGVFPFEQSYTHEWGNTNIYITPYRDKVYQIKVTAINKKKRKSISYRFLQSTP